MDRRFLCASALSLIVAPIHALAQPGGKHGGHGGGQPSGGGHGPPGGGGGGGHGGHEGPHGGGAPPARGPAGGGHMERSAPRQAPVRGHERGPTHERAISGGGHTPTGRFAPSRHERAPASVGPYRPGQGRPANFHAIRAQPFRYPSGWRYRRWAIGAVLPALFLTPVFIFDDYWRLGLPGPPYGYVWVRYGPDLLLVELGTGRVVDVIYGAFYY